MSASRRKGTAWETAIVDWLRGRGFPHAERRALRGGRDAGDVTGVPGLCVEAKNAKTITLAGWVDELAAEVDNANADIGVLWIKRRGRASAGDGYVVMTPDHLVVLLRAAGFAPPQAYSHPPPSSTP